MTLRQDIEELMAPGMTNRATIRRLVDEIERLQEQVDELSLPPAARWPFPTDGRTPPTAAPVVLYAQTRAVGWPLPPAPPVGTPHDPWRVC